MNSLVKNEDRQWHRSHAGWEHGGQRTGEEGKEEKIDHPLLRDASCYTCSIMSYYGNTDTYATLFHAEETQR